MTRADISFSPQESLDLRTRLLYVWELVVLVILSPLILHQRAISAHRTVFSASSSQPVREIWADIFPTRSPRWRQERDMPDQTDRVAIVTGGNTGIGFETVRGLIRKGARVYVASRDHRRSRCAIAALRADCDRGKWPGEVKLLALDLCDMESIQSATDEFLRTESSLHMLICNAGVANPPAGQRTAQGYDLTLGTNVLGHHQLIHCLVPVLQRTAKQSGASSNKVRVCILSSYGHNVHQPSGFDCNDPEWQARLTLSLFPGIPQLTINPRGPAREILKYGHSKFCNVLQAKRLHRKYGSQGIVFTAVDPGNIVSDLLRNRDAFFNVLYKCILTPLLLFHPTYGAITQLWACTAPEAAIIGGQYLGPWARLAPAAAPTEQHHAQDALHDWCEQQLKAHGYR